MTDQPDKRFEELVAMLESLESAYVSADEDSERDRIKVAITRLIGQMTDEHMVAYKLYIEERMNQVQSNLEHHETILSKLQSELQSRRNCK